MQLATYSRKFLSTLPIIAQALAACLPEATTPTPVVTVPQPDIPDSGDAIADEDQGDVEANTLGADPSEDVLPATYTDDELGFSFNYPMDWYVQGTAGFSAVLTSYPPEEEDDDVTAEETKIDFVLLETDEQVEALIESQQGQINEAGNTVTNETTIEFGENISAYVISYSTDEGELEVVAITQVNDSNFIISGQGDLTLFEQILRSLGPST